MERPGHQRLALHRACTRLRSSYSNRTPAFFLFHDESHGTSGGHQGGLASALYRMLVPPANREQSTIPTYVITTAIQLLLLLLLSPLLLLLPPEQLSPLLLLLPQLLPPPLLLLLPLLLLPLLLLLPMLLLPRHYLRVRLHLLPEHLLLLPQI